METVKIIECPRDAWQGLAELIPTEAKVAYLRKLITAGFRHLDAVSFVSPKYVPQMADSEGVMAGLVPYLQQEDIAQSAAGGVPNPDPRPPISEIIGIVVNEQGLERALKAPGVTAIGYPYSVSANFRRANAHMSKAESQALVEKLQSAVQTAGARARKLVVYISMAFGNNYDEPWGPEIVVEAVQWLKHIGVRQVSLADTIGAASAEEVGDLYGAVKGAISGGAAASAASARFEPALGAAPSLDLNAAPGRTTDFELGVHLHSTPDGAAEKVLAAYQAGCRCFDSALTGLGGCPFAGDDLVGNIPTEIVVSALSAQGADTGIEPWALLSAVEATKELRARYAHA